MIKENFERFLIDRNYKFKKENDNLTVGDSLDLRGTNITQLPDDLVVGDSLDLEGTNITQLPDGLVVGGSLDLEGTNITQSKIIKRPDKNFKNILAYKTQSIIWRNGKYRKIDGIFCEI